MLWCTRPLISHRKEEEEEGPPPPPPSHPSVPDGGIFSLTFPLTHSLPTFLTLSGFFQHVTGSASGGVCVCVCMGGGGLLTEAFVWPQRHVLLLAKRGRETSLTGHRQLWGGPLTPSHPQDAALAFPDLLSSLFPSHFLHVQKVRPPDTGVGGFVPDCREHL